MRKIRRLCVLALGVGMLVTGGCGSEKSVQHTEILHLTFDEGTGSLVADSTQTHGDSEVQYRYTKAVYTEDMDPQWRECGMQGGSLLFDGNSTYISYDADELSLDGQELSVSVWVAPRAFEWDDPNAKSMNTQELTAIVSQYNKDRKQGVLFGYGRYGQPCLEIGAEDGWHTVWGDGRLTKDAWNCLAFTYDAANGEIRLYLNGELIGKDSVKGQAAIVAASREKLLIGKNSHATAIAAGTYHMFSGLMDELHIYKSVLSEEECAVTGEIPEIAYADIALVDILGDDIYKTQYHGGPYQHWMNEPHAPLYYNGMYHLFFQQNMVGTYWRNIQWGHLVSRDMVNWKPVKEAICATEDTVVPDGVWSGNAVCDANGVPLLFFTAGNDSYRNAGLLSNQNIGVAYPADLTDPELGDWVIYDELAVKQEAAQGRTGEFRDPFLWKEGDVWCMLVCSGSVSSNGGAALLYTTETLELFSDGSIAMDWKYRGSIYEMENQPVTYGTSWELPILLPLSNEAGTVTKYMFMISPAPAGTADNKAYFFLGDFDPASGKFTPDEAYANQPGLLDYGDNVFTGPSAIVDPVTERTCLFSIMQDKRNGAEEGTAGWAHCVGLAREIWLNDDGTDLCVRPIEELNQLEKVLLEEKETLSVAEANERLAGVAADLLHVRITFAASGEEAFGISVKSDGKNCYTKYWYENGMIYGETTDRGSAASPGASGGALCLPDGRLSMDIYIDRSLVEGFFNESKALSIRSYSDYEAQGIEVSGGSGVRIEEIYVAEMRAAGEK
ncbi:MAG: GH32 C-terminal domain-containing protein [Muribaculaceae bacterium]|nr:GH32 C-terminal domain-containing protein [Roseburia sp.]MCM1430672.1 GH32 C-terminal domain-containing protein [Muribaculaceae bacterium]MCM1491939.1 GH32 C-terminal domain-containing protein [Muribaculaceae bacterium]